MNKKTEKGRREQPGRAILLESFWFYLLPGKI